MAHSPSSTTEARDFVEHERTYEGFLRLATIGTIWVLTQVVALAIGGVAGHWIQAGFWVFVSTIAAVLGLAIRSLDWRPVLVVLVLMLLSLLLISY
jgi:aa3 type cytochrome c oxidase subunit IV